MNSKVVAAQRPRTGSGDGKYFLISVVGHTLVLFGLLQLAGIGPLEFFDKLFAPDKVKEQPTEEAPAEAGELMVDVTPFQGISYSEWERRRKDRASQKSTANAVLARLKGLKFGAGGSAPQVAKGGGAPDIDVSTGKTPSASALVSRQDFAVRSATIEAKAGVRKMTDQERAELKKRFRELEREFRKAFARALNDDPDFRVTVAFEAEVRRDGKLSVRRFLPRGRYRQESLRILEEAMRSGIGNVAVASDLAGTLIRGESVFMK